MQWMIGVYLIGFAGMLLTELVWIVAVGKETANKNNPARLFVNAVLWPICMWMLR